MQSEQAFGVGVKVIVAEGEGVSVSVGVKVSVCAGVQVSITVWGATNVTSGGFSTDTWQTAVTVGVTDGSVVQFTEAKPVSVFA